MQLSISIVGKSGVGKKSLIELINQQMSIELVQEKADIGLMIFDITDKSSYDYIRNRYNQENKISFLVANKIDLEDKRTVQSEIAAKFASRLTMSYHEISCITKQNVSHLLYMMSSNQSSSNRSQTFSQRQQQPTISVLKFNRLSLKNASYSQTESEQKESSESRVSNLPSRQNDPNRSKSQTAVNFTNQQEHIPIQKTRTQELDSNRSQEMQQHIQDFYLSTNQPIKEEANSKEQTLIIPDRQGSFSRTEMDMDIDQQRQELPDISQKSFIQYQTTPIQSQIFLLNQIEQGENRERHRTFKQSPKGLPDLGFRRYTTNSFQRSHSKLQSQIFTQRSQVLLDQNDKLKQLLDQMQNGIQELKEFQDQMTNSEIIEQKQKEIMLTKVFDSFDPDKLIRQQQHLKKESMNVYEIKQLIKQQQILSNGTQNNNNIHKTNYFQTVTERSENNNNNNNNNNNDQKNELILLEQVREQFRTTPVKQLNYRSVTPGKQIIRHIELESPKNERILNLQYKLKNGKQIVIQFRRKDNLIKVAHDIATKHKLDHQVYLQILHSLKQKSNQALEELKSNRNIK